MHGSKLALAAAFAFALSTPALAEITIEEVIAIARDNGMETFREVERDDGRWEVEGRDADGRELEIYIHAETGEVLGVERD
jgi:uncharacterized membrane protein YkoI